MEVLPLIFSLISNGPPPLIATVRPPVITADPESMLDVRGGSTITLSVAAEGLRLAFSWQRTDGEPISLSSRVEGESTSQLTIRGARREDSGGYRCEVSNAAGTVRSRVATIIVSKYAHASKEAKTPLLVVKMFPKSFVYANMELKLLLWSILIQIFQESAGF